MAPVRYTLEYAAPEVVAAWEAGAAAAAANRAADVWAYGVLAYELLTTRRAFPLKLTESEVRDSSHAASCCMHCACVRAAHAVARVPIATDGFRGTHRSHRCGMLRAIGRAALAPGAKARAATCAMIFSHTTAQRARS
jgi:hypothetical protein